MVSLYRIILLIVLLFTGSCSDEEILVGGEKVNFIKDNIVINKQLSLEDPKLNKQIKNTNWVQKGGNKYHSLSNISFKMPLQKMWTFDTDQEISEDNPFLILPVSFANKLYILNSEGFIFCLNKKDGSLVWKKKYFKEDEDTLLGSGSLVFDKFRNSIIAHNGKNKIISINSETKKIDWSLMNQLPFRGSLSISGNNLVVNDYDGNLLNINTDSGSIIWKKKLGSSSMSIYSNARPVIAKNLVVNPGPNGIFHVLRLDTGRLIYSDILPKNNDLAIFNNNDIIANPIFYDGNIYILSHSGTFSAYDHRTFKSLWNISIGGKNTPLISGETIFVIDNLARLLAIKAITGEVRWKTKFKNQKQSGYIFEKQTVINYHGPFLVDNKILIFNTNGDLFYLNPKDGKIVTKKSFNELAAAPLFFTDHIIFLFSDGKISRFN